MPNGKVGDDWFTDIVEHGLSTFSPRADTLVNEIDGLIPEARPPELIGLVRGFLAAVGDDTLAERGASDVELPYRCLTESETGRLEAALQELRDTFARSGRGAY